LGVELRILIVEDSEEDTFLLLADLKRGGFVPAYVRVDTPTAMLEALRNQEWDIIISDYVMPRFSGLAALKLLQDAKLDLPFIIVSGHIGEDIAVEAMRAGAHDYIIKGNYSRLVPAIVRELREASIRKEMAASTLALRESDAQLRLLFENMLDGYAYCEGIVVNGRLEDFVYLTVNSAFQKLTGFHDVIGKRVTELVPGIKESDPGLFEIYEKVIQTGVPRRFETFIESLGLWLTISVYSTRDHCFVAVFDNITERKQAENILLQMAERDRHIADVLQQSIMLFRKPIQPDGYEIAAKYRPALSEAEVCGDFCDIFELGNGKIGITIGDVVGKGLLGAVRVAAARNAIRCYAYIDTSPSNVMSLVNEALCRDMLTENDMLTAFFAILDIHANTFTYSNAGHEPPLVRHPNGKTESLSAGGPMFIGMGSQVYQEASLDITTGDVLVMVTDGITEARKTGQANQFGVEGIINSLSRSNGASADDIAKILLQDASSFAHKTLRDDAAIVVIKKASHTSSV